MRFPKVLAASLMVAPFVAGHNGIPGTPKIFGMGSGVKRDLFRVPARRNALPWNKPEGLRKRQGGTDGQCGPSGGGATCADGYCCSATGSCGIGKDYCSAPDCLIDYGPGCDANKIPNGEDTRNIARPQSGNVLYGGDGIYSCQQAGTIAITYDDGPYIYTSQVLDVLAQYNTKATFFVTGNNNGKGAIDDASTAWPAVISRMASEGHQIASHTWSHQDLSVITQEQRINQMVRNEMAIRNIIQKFPTYMRPPYSSCNAACEADLATLGYHIIYFNLDTDDYDNDSPDKIQVAKDNFNTPVGNSNPATDSFLTIMHDIHQQTAANLTSYVLDIIQQKGYRAVTVGECLGDPEANWYRASSGQVVSSASIQTRSTSTSAPSGNESTSTPDGPLSDDGSCGGTDGYTCMGSSDGECCSQEGWCGSSVEYCGTGCNPLFGRCGVSTSSFATFSEGTSVANTPLPTNATFSPVISSIANSSAVQTISNSTNSSTLKTVTGSTNSSSTPTITSRTKASTLQATIGCADYTTTLTDTDSVYSSTILASDSSTESPALIATSPSTITTQTRTSTVTSIIRASAKPTPTTNVSNDGRCDAWYSDTNCA